MAEMADEFKSPLVADNNEGDWFLMMRDDATARLIDVAAMCSLNGYGEQHAVAIARAVNSNALLVAALGELVTGLRYLGMPEDSEPMVRANAALVAAGAA